MSMLSPIQRLAPYDAGNSLGYHFCDTSDATVVDEIPRNHYEGPTMVAEPQPPPIQVRRKPRRRLSAAERAKIRFYRIVRVAKHRLHHIQKAVLGMVVQLQDKTQRLTSFMAHLAPVMPPALQPVMQAPQPTQEPTPVPKQEYREISVLAARLLRVIAQDRKNRMRPNEGVGTTIAKHP